MFLTREEQEMCEGKYGPGIEKAMKMLIKYGEAFDAERMLPLKSGHLLADPYDWVSEMTEGADKVRAFTTTHAGFPPREMWEKMGIGGQSNGTLAPEPDPVLALQDRLGCIPTATCVPYLVGNVPKWGNPFSWPGSSGIIISNSLFGARGNRDASPVNWLSAVTGRTPDMLLQKREHRYGQILVELGSLGLENFSDADFGALSYYVGGVAGSDNVVYDGVPGSISFENMKYLLSPLSVSGSVSLCHIVGITPEAPTVAGAFGGRKPEQIIEVGLREIDEGRKSLNTAESDEIDLVILGCPHCTILELKEVASLLEGRKISSNTRLWLATAYQIYVLAERAGFIEIIERAGGAVITGTCVGPAFLGPVREGVKVVATNSARAAHYIVRGGGQPVGVLYGNTRDCIDSALTGKWRVT